MAYVINVCLDSDKYPKCQGCPHHKLDPERRFEEDPRDRYACYIDEDLKGKERLDYLTRLLKAFESGEAVVPPTHG